jgi:hypothetical protein
MKEKKDKALIQQIHKDCEGELVVVAGNVTREFYVACSECRQQWVLPLPFGVYASDDFINTKI